MDQPWLALIVIFAAFIAFGLATGRTDIGLAAAIAIGLVGGELIRRRTRRQ
jgi:phosphotransferase system  glucose/maltose/N-acetylglucosamine-specific IIC component